LPSRGVEVTAVDVGFLLRRKASQVRPVGYGAREPSGRGATTTSDSSPWAGGLDGIDFGPEYAADPTRGNTATLLQDARSHERTITRALP